MDTMLTPLYIATFLSGVMPGPCTVLGAARTASNGPRSGVLVSAGVFVGVNILTCLAFGAILGFLTISGNALALMKLAGILALLLLAAWTVRPKPPTSHRRSRITACNDFCAGLIVVVSSPFVLTFQMALLPQFIAPGEADFGPALIAASTFAVGVALSMASGVLFGVFSARSDGATGRWVTKASAILLVGFAGAAAFAPVG